MRGLGVEAACLVRLPLDVAAEGVGQLTGRFGGVLPGRSTSRGEPARQAFRGQVRHRCLLGRESGRLTVAMNNAHRPTRSRRRTWERRIPWARGQRRTGWSLPAASASCQRAPYSAMSNCRVPMTTHSVEERVLKPSSGLLATVGRLAPSHWRDFSLPGAASVRKIGKDLRRRSEATS